MIKKKLIIGFVAKLQTFWAARHQSRQTGGCFWQADSPTPLQPSAFAGYDCHRRLGTLSTYESERMPISSCLDSPPPLPPSPPDPPHTPVPNPSPPSPPGIPTAAAPICGYTVIPESVSHQEAFQRCENMGAQPAMIKSAQDNAEMLASLLPPVTEDTELESAIEPFRKVLTESPSMFAGISWRADRKAWEQAAWRGGVCAAVGSEGSSKAMESFQAQFKSPIVVTKLWASIGPAVKRGTLSKAEYKEMAPVIMEMPMVSERDVRKACE